MALPGGPLGNFGFPSDPNFDRGFRTVKRGVGCFGFAFLIQALIGLGLVGLVIYVAAHFLAKVW